MKGLLVKDFYLLWKYCRLMLVMAAVIVGMGCLVDGMSSFMIFSCMLCGMVPMTLYAYDERDRWHVYAQTLPVSKKQYVLSKYLIGLITGGAMMLLTIALQLVRAAVSGGFSVELGIMLLLLVIGSLLPCALLMPFVFRFGAEKGRILYLILVGGGCGAGVALSESFSGSFPQVNAVIWTTLLPFVLAGIYLLSIALSVWFYEKREL